MKEIDEPPSSTAFLSLAALGIVFGDIGTSPLYAIRECFHGAHAIPAAPSNILGVLSLVFWALTLIISLKYLAYVVRADNRGEGGILSLMSLVYGRREGRQIHRGILAMGLFGAALLYGDGMITPAISVLSAIEGLEVITPAMSSYVVPVTAAVLMALFALQRLGTARVGVLFGPVMVVWFLTLGALGVRSIAETPAVLGAVSPLHAARFLFSEGHLGFKVLGAVFLVVTGGEAIYADLGHFGRRPIRLSWFFVAFPALALNYFGQGALLLRHPAFAENPFYHLAPRWGLYPLVFLSTAATVIASQAVITGAFSLTRQAVQLGYLPRMRIVHTSAETIGQIYMPGVNWLLCFATVGLVAAFERSTNLAAAYGIAVSTTMLITSLLAYLVARRRWGWPRSAAMGLTAAWMALDLAFLWANWAKFSDGGWVPVCAAFGVVVVFLTWRKGQADLRLEQEKASLPITQIIDEAKNGEITRVPGTAVFFTAVPGRTPNALLHNLKHNKVLHKRNVFVTIVTEEIPHIPSSERVQISELSPGFDEVLVRYGFMEEPNLPRVMETARKIGLKINPDGATYILSRNTLILGGVGGWRRAHLILFRILYRNALRSGLFFQLPPNRVIEIGRQVSLVPRS